MSNQFNLTKKTKIVCTIGPASSNRDTILKMLEAGMDIARMNFSHSDHTHHQAIFELLRNCEADFGRPLGILADLQGPKIRTGKLGAGPIELERGQKIYINSDPDYIGHMEEIGCTYPQIVSDLKEGNIILIDDGKIQMRVLNKSPEKALMEVEIPGTLRNNKGINLPGTEISAPALSAKDIEDLKFAMSLGVDFIALSFVRSARDLELAQELIKGSFCGLIAKIERPEALQNIDAIINACDGIMIARGDLGVELDAERVPIIQKNLIRKMNEIGKPVITATQMLESMIDNPRPTRAETSDVANAVIDGTDAVMLSGESASGSFPVEAVSVMKKIITESEKVFISPFSAIHEKRSESEIERTALGTAAEQIAKSIHAKAIINFTRSGYSARLSSEFRPDAPIFSFTPFLMTARKMNLYRGVYPYVMPMMDKFQDMIHFMNRKLKEDQYLKSGDNIVILAGAPGGEAYTVDFIQIFTMK